MQFFTDLFNNFPIVMAFFAWLTAQLIKLVLTLVFYPKDFSLSILLSSGGMPSSHSATVCALATAILITDGIGSSTFAVAAVLSFIVMYDARGVRRSAGEQAKKINNIIEHLSDNDDEFESEDPVKEILGHTPLQVTIGAIIGIAFPVVVKLIAG